MTWFERTFGFSEESPDQVRSQLTLRGERLTSEVNGFQIGCGRLRTPSLAELRALDRTEADEAPSSLREVVGDVGSLHRDPEHAGALFQVASQFNLLEMVDPKVTPERGVGRYENDPTQGPACAIACGGGTVYRNYFVPHAGGLGQTSERQLDMLEGLEEALGGGHWEMSNGYALATRAGLEEIAQRLGSLCDEERDAIGARLRVGVQHEVEVIGAEQRVTQVYGSALPVGYTTHPPAAWEPFARLVLEASYEATLRVARLWQTGPVFLTLLGGGVFRNAPEWIADAILRAVGRVPGLDVRIVSYGGPNPAVARLVEQVGQAAPAQVRARTSRSHPIRVDFVDGPGGPPIGLTFAPGKVQAQAATGAWKRSLEADLDRLADHYGVDDLVCLVEDHELAELRIEGLAARAEERGIGFHRFAIRDVDVPRGAGFDVLLREITEARAAGRTVVVHCKGGLGRAGTVASCALVAAGMSPSEALAAVRRARPGAVETRDQERFVLGRARS